MLTRRRLLTGTFAGAAGLGAVALTGTRPGWANPALAGEQFIRTGDPPVAITVPNGWITNDAWMSQAVDPVPLVAVQSRDFSLITDADDGLIPNESMLPPDAVALTIAGVRLLKGEAYMVASASASSFSAADAPLTPTNVGDVLSAFAWVMRADIGWGYLVYGWIGPQAGSDAMLFSSLLNSIRFST